MKGLLLILLLIVLPARAAMDITRELVAPDNVVPGQPLRVAVTFWTDTWFNPPPQWPDFIIEYGSLLTSPLPSIQSSGQPSCWIRLVTSRPPTSARFIIASLTGLPSTVVTKFSVLKSGIAV